MHITLVIDQFDSLNNGTTVSAHRYAEELRKRGHKVTILAAEESGENKIGVPVKKIPLFQHIIEKQGFCFAKKVDEAYYQAFKEADIIHFYLPTWFCRRGEKIARQMKKPTIASFHLQPENITYSIGLGKAKWANEFLYRYFYNTFYNRFRFIHCPSRFIANQLEQHGYDAEIRVISNGVDEKFKPMKFERPGEWQDKFVILMIGRLSGEKRQDLIMKAVNLSRYRDRIQLIFAGRGPKENEYKQLARKLQLPNRPIFGFYPQEDLLRLINTCDLYVHASDAEIEGISCMEAMACGLVPVISDSELSATKDYSLHEYSLFRAGDPKSLAERIDYWIEHPEERAEMGIKYAEKMDNIRVGDCVSQAEKLYQEVIDDFAVYEYKEVKESWIRRITHPDVDKINQQYYSASLLQRWTFYLFTNILALIVFVIDSALYGLKVEGRENLRKVKGGAITVMNHVHPMDFTMVKVAVFPRRIYFTSLRSNLELPFVGWLIKQCGALPLPVKLGEKITFQKQLKNGISRGDWIHFYPEGMMVKHHRKLREFRTSAFITAVNNNCPVIPMAIVYLKPQGLWHLLSKRDQMVLVIGEPLYPKAAVSKKEAVQELAERTRIAMEELMSKQIYAVKWNLPSVVRLACIVFLTMRIIRIFWPV